MKFNLKTRPKTLTPNEHNCGDYLWVNPQEAAIWFESFEKELREHYHEYKELAKPPECDETWYCLQYLELLVEEILGDIDTSKQTEKTSIVGE